MEGNTLIILILIGGVAALLIYFKRMGDSTLERETEEQTQRFIEEFQSAGDKFEKNGIPTIESDISLSKKDTLHARLNGIKWMEYRKVSTGRVTTHGLTGRIKIAKGLSYRYGTGHVARETMDQLKEIDAGDIYVTNNGFFFRGIFGNKNLPFDKVINLIPFPTGLKIEKETGKDVYIPYDFKSSPNKAAMIALLWDKIKSK